MQHWLFKCEPSAFSIDDLEKAPNQTTFWDGVRNYQARNFLRDHVQKGDLAFFYHSNAEPSGIAGLMTVTQSGYPDPSQFNPKSKYFEATSKKDAPTWYCVDVTFKKKCSTFLPLDLLRKQKALKDMELLKKGSRLSIQPVSKAEFAHILTLF